MPNGTLVGRQYILILNDGQAVIDWGNGDNVYQDILSGDFVHIPETEISHVATNEDLDLLRHAGCVEQYDPFHAWVLALPDKNQRTLD